MITYNFKSEQSIQEHYFDNIYELACDIIDKFDILRYTEFVAVYTNKLNCLELLKFTSHISKEIGYESNLVYDDIDTMYIYTINADGDVYIERMCSSDGVVKDSCSILTYLDVDNCTYSVLKSLECNENILEFGFNNKENE